MSIKENYEKIKENIEKACLRAKRNSKDIQILGVCKSQSAERIREAFECGVTLMGENKTQEAEVHQEELNSLPIKWHFIGKLQKNKINKILNGFDFIQSVDGVKSLEHIGGQI